MTDKKQDEGEIIHPKSHPPVDSEAVTPRFDKSDAMVGQMLDGRFLVKKDLTEGGADAGGIGLVYLAEDLKLLGRQVVVKILQKAALKNPDILRKFQHEKEALIRLDHPNIVRILDSGTLSDGNPFMVMDYIQGYSLRRVLSQKKELSFLFCAHIIETVTSALGAAHAEKILHRDIKPENIMLTPQQEGAERVRVIDFGIARVENAKLAPSTEIERAIGTVKYMPPEQLLGKLNQTPAGDIYSCAILAYELLMGEQPFKPASIAEMYDLQKQSGSFLPGRFRISIPEEARNLILHALAFNPSERPQDARKFGMDLAKALRQASAAATVGGQSEDSKNGNSKENTGKVLTPTEPLSSLHQPLSSKSNDSLSVVTKIKTPDTANSIQLEKSRGENSKLPVYLGTGLLILAAVGSLIGLALWGFSALDFNKTVLDSGKAANLSSENTVESPNHKLTYFLDVQKMRDGKPFQPPFRSSGQEVFENGYKFKMVFQSDAEGFVYLYSEDKDASGKTVYYILYPSLKNNNGSAFVPSGQSIETPDNHFSGNPGTEVVWLIWTANKMDVLEAIKQSAYPQIKIENEKDVRQLTDFLQKYKDRKNEVEKDTSNRQTVINGNGDVIVQRIELEHR